MGLFRFNPLRRFIRRYFQPVAEGRAAVWKSRLSIGYVIVSWNTFGFVCYMILKGKGDWVQYYGHKSEEDLILTPAQQWARTLGIKDAKVYSVSGFNVQSYEIHRNENTNEDNV